MKIRSFILLLLGISLLTAQESPRYKQSSVPLEERVNDLLPRLTLEEKLDLLSGTGFASKPLPRLGIPSLDMTDGPVGVRWEKSVAFPASIMLAATFDTALARQYGAALARETKAKGRNTILGPCVNINRIPNGGRNFESYGEDPFLTSRIAVSYVKGVQQEGVVATTKHFAVNNQETDRMTVNAVVDKRSLYEIYFPAFKAAVQEAKTEAIMCAYNKLNGPYCSENEMLLNTVLKKEWKFDGLVMSDWGAVHSTEGVATYGLDLEMPGGDFLTKEKLMPLVTSGKVKEAVIDDKLRRLFRVMFRMGYFDRPLEKPVTNAPEQRSVALDVACNGLVLLKNENHLLPLSPASVRSVAVIGPNAEQIRAGGGSSMVWPATDDAPLAAVRRAFPNAAITYAVGARLSGDIPAIGAPFFFLPNDSTNRHGLQAEYFDNKELKGEPKLRRVDSTIAFWWGGGAPAEGFGKDNFSVRWTGRLVPPVTGTYELMIASDDGMRLSIDGKKVLDHWGDHGVEARTVSMDLTAGRSYAITAEFYENGGDAVAKLGWRTPHESDLDAAVDAAKKSDVALVFVGNSAFQESEGFDRPSISLAKDQEALVTAVAAANPKTVVVLNAGAQMDLLPWLEKIPALVWAFFPGQEGAQAISDVITGAQNPSGKLPFTIAKRFEDYSAAPYFPGKNGSVEYTEGLLVGYRHFDTKKITPLYPFGFGLSYTTFTVGEPKVAVKKGDDVSVTVTVKNTGAVRGTEVVQLYVHDNGPALFRPEKELKAFARVTLAPGESKNVALKLNTSSFRYYDDTKNEWVRSTKGYELLIGTSSGAVTRAGTVR